MTALIGPGVGEEFLNHYIFHCLCMSEDVSVRKKKNSKSHVGPDIAVSLRCCHVFTLLEAYCIQL